MIKPTANKPNLIGYINPLGIFVLNVRVKGVEL